MTSSPLDPSASARASHVFDRRVDEVRPSKLDINRAIMDYLISEGYPMAAKRFAHEANIFCGPHQQSIQQRVEIRNAIHAGSIESAIHKINDLNPQILDGDEALHFSLLRLQLIELIRECIYSPTVNIQPALAFATSELAPRAPTNPQFRDDLEHTMALLVFGPDKLTPPLARLLEPSLRQAVAAKVNEAILAMHGSRREARIKHLVRLRVWSEEKARESSKDIPSNLSLGLDAEKVAVDGDNEDGIMNDSGQ